MATKKLPVQIDDGLLTPREVAAVLKVHLIGLQNMRLKGKGPPWIKPGSRVYYPQRLFEEWLNRTLIVPDQERVA